MRVGDNWQRYGDKITPCSLVFPDEVEVTEKNVRGFDGDDFTIEPVTDMRGTDEPIKCACGKLNNVTIRVDGDIQYIILEALQLNYISGFTYDFTKEKENK